MGFVQLEVWLSVLVIRYSSTIGRPCKGSTGPSGPQDQTDIKWTVQKSIDGITQITPAKRTGTCSRWPDPRNSEETMNMARRGMHVGLGT